MKSLPEPKDRRELESLLSAFCDGNLDVAQQKRLAEVLREDTEARRFYLHYIDIHLDLAHRAEIEKLIPLAPLIPPRKPRPWNWTAGVAAAVVAILAVALWPRSTNQQTAADDVLVEQAPEPVAFVSRADSVTWSHPAPATPGLRLDAGAPLDLDSGRLRIDFFDGTAVTIVAPSTFALEDGSGIGLKAGQLIVHAAESSSGFAVRTPEASFVDIGTKFAVNARVGEATQLLVMEGEVISTLFSEDGAPLDELSATSGQFLSLDRVGGIVRSELDPALFAEMLSPAPLPLRIPKEYVAAVLADAPLGYWRFEGTRDGLAPDTTGNGRDVTILGNAHLEGTPDNQAMVFDPEDEMRGLLVATPFEAFKTGHAYSLELWMNPQNDDLGGLSTLIEVDAESIDEVRKRPPSYRVMAIECMSGDPNHWFRAPPASIGFFHRIRTQPKERPDFDKWKKRNGDDGRKFHNPDQHRKHRNDGVHDKKDWKKHWRGKGGWDGKRDHESRVYSMRRYTPGTWHHVVAVREPSRVLLYLDGKLEAETEATSDDNLADLRLVIGRYSLAGGKFGRAFTGRIDEVALYDRALTAEEIASHFRLVGPQ